VEALARLGAFLTVFTVMALWETAHPRRSLAETRWVRWPTNLGLTLLDTVLVRVTVGGAAYAAASFAAQREMGLLHWLDSPAWAAALITVLALDLAIYFQHVIFHAVPILWRVHRVHHADVGFDATTGLRFHPIEIFLSLAFKTAVIVLLGAAPWAVVLFEVILNASSVFNHGNVQIRENVDRWLRWLIVTPDMHRVHHSTRVVETNSNFGFSVPWWDRLFGTYRAAPALGHVRMEIGLSEYRRPLGLAPLLMLPFQGGGGSYTFGGARTVSPEELSAELSPGPPPLVLDVRNADEFTGDLGHIDGSVLIPLPELGKRLDELAAYRDRRIITV
jgi:sterol desaturase/sphingolipid hydroxylase (fatty acid hydroxylase superfamily)